MRSDPKQWRGGEREGGARSEEVGGGAGPKVARGQGESGGWIQRAGGGSERGQTQSSAGSRVGPEVVAGVEQGYMRSSRGEWGACGQMQGSVPAATRSFLMGNLLVTMYKPGSLIITFI